MKKIYKSVFSLTTHLRNPKKGSLLFPSKVFFIKTFTIAMLAITGFFIFLNPTNLSFIGQILILTLLQIPIHEYAHFVMAKRFFRHNQLSENKADMYLKAIDSPFAKKYLVPRFGFNSFYGIKSLKIIPSVFLQELLYTGRQFALIALAGPVVDIACAILYIITTLILGPKTLLGFFTTQILLFFGIFKIIAEIVSFLMKQLDLGKFRYSQIKRNAYNRFLMAPFYLHEAELDTEENLALIENKGLHPTGYTRLTWLFRKLQNGSVSDLEFDLLIEAVIAANPPMEILIQTGELLESLKAKNTLSADQMTELETAIKNVEKALQVHVTVSRIDDPLYVAFDHAEKGFQTTITSERVQTMLRNIKAKLGIVREIPYFVIGGKLIVVIERRDIEKEKTNRLITLNEFEVFVTIQSPVQKRKRFQGRKTIQVGVAIIHAPQGEDLSRELAHAEILWELLKERPQIKKASHSRKCEA